MVSGTRVLVVNPLSPVIRMMGPLWIRPAPACPIVLGSGEPSSWGLYGVAGLASLYLPNNIDMGWIQGFPIEDCPTAICSN